MLPQRDASLQRNTPATSDNVQHQSAAVLHEPSSAQLLNLQAALGAPTVISSDITGLPDNALDVLPVTADQVDLQSQQQEQDVEESEAGFSEASLQALAQQTVTAIGGVAERFLSNDGRDRRSNTGSSPTPRVQAPGSSSTEAVLSVPDAESVSPLGRFAGAAVAPSVTESMPLSEGEIALLQRSATDLREV